MQKDLQFSPGVLRVFRLYLAIQWLLLLVELLASRRHPPFYQNGLTFFSWILATLLCLFLFWGQLRRVLGRAYLPTALIIASVGPVVNQMLATIFWLLHSQPTSSVQALVDPTTFYGSLILPLLLISTLYGLRVLLSFTIGTAVLSLLQVWLLALSNPDVMEMVLSHIASRFFLFTICGLVIVLLSQERRLQHYKLEQKNAQLAHYLTTLEQLAISRERNRMARELHDTLAHTLSALNIQLKALAVHCASAPQNVHSMIEQMQDLTHTGLTEARHALHNLRASPLQQMDLITALRQTCEQSAQRASMSLTLDLPPQYLPLPPEIEQQLYRITEEALSNVERHANASHLFVALQQTPHWVQIVIRDDGDGFAVGDGALHAGHYGLTGMRERAELIGALLEIRSQPMGGTTVWLHQALERGRL